MASNYIDPAFQIGMMLGDAYGSMWAANAKSGKAQKLMILLSRCRTNVQFSVLLTLVEQA